MCQPNRPVLTLKTESAFHKAKRLETKVLAAKAKMDEAIHSYELALADYNDAVEVWHDQMEKELPPPVRLDINGNIRK